MSAEVWCKSEDNMQDVIVEEDAVRFCRVTTEEGGGGGGGTTAGSNTNNNTSTTARSITMDKDEKRMRREIANSNERRRMQSINAGFQSLRQMLPHHEGEKLSKAAILQQTAEYIYALEQEKTSLLQQNCHLKRLLDQQDHNGAVAAAAAAELQQATTQTGTGTTVLTTAAPAAVISGGPQGTTAAAGAAGVAQVTLIAKKRKNDAIMAVQPVSDSSDEGLGSMSPEPVSLMQVVNNGSGQTIVTATVNGRPCPTINVSAKDYLDLKHQLEIERRQKVLFEERLKALERQIYPARVLYKDPLENIETSEPLEEITVSAIPKTVATTKVTRELENVQLIALESGKKLVVCTPEVIEETVQQHPIIKPTIVPLKEEKVFIKRSRSRSPTIDTVVTLPPKKNRYPTILEAAIKAEPKVEVERIDSPSSIIVSEDHLTHLASTKLVAVQQQQQQQQASSPFNTCRHNLETIVEAIRHLEGDNFDSVVPVSQQHQQPQSQSASSRPVQDVPLALTTTSKHQQQKERESRQSQLEPYLKFRTGPTGTYSASSSSSATSSSTSIPSGPTSSSGGSKAAVVSVSITPTVALTSGHSSPSPSSTVSSIHHSTATSQLLQQQCRPGVIVVKQNS